RKPSRLALIRSVSDWKRSLPPASPAGWALFITTPPSGSFVMSLRGGPLGGGVGAAAPVAGALPGSAALGDGEGLGGATEPGSVGDCGGGCPLEHAAKERAPSVSPRKMALAVAQARMRPIVVVFAAAARVDGATPLWLAAWYTSTVTARPAL